MRLIQNPDTDYAKDIKRQLKKNNGYCVCAMTKTHDTKCKCKDFRDQIERNEPGMCRCGLWLAVED